MITCVGNPVFDSITTLHLKSDGRVLSGCSTNACLALSKLGMDVFLVGRIGTDFAKQFKSQMEYYNIRFSLEKSEQSGGFELNYTDEKGSRTLNILGDAGKIDTFPQELSSSDWILFGPILMALAEATGADPVLMGVVACMTLSIGAVTPPYGLCLMIACRLGEIRVGQGFRRILPLLILEVLIVNLAIFFPDMVLFLPRLMLSTGG